jgi:hypothetical protein
MIHHSATADVMAAIDEAAAEAVLTHEGKAQAFREATRNRSRTTPLIAVGEPHGSFAEDRF